jgi:hypothetical protein
MTRGALSNPTRPTPSRLAAALVALALLTAAEQSRAAEDAAWTSDLPDSTESLVGDALLEDELLVDPNFTLAQAAQQSPSERPPSSRTASRSARTSRVPFMIGDQSTGLSGGLTVEGLDVSSFEHPIFGGNRFNVAENNTIVPVDRFSLNYRHFHNAYDTYALGQSRSTSVERFDLGFEKTFLEGMGSVQVVLPLLRQLGSDLDIYDDGVGGSNLPITDRHGEVGNLAINFKMLLTTRDNYAIAGGVAVNTPTAEDAYFTQNFDDPDLVILQSPFVSSVTPTDVSITSRFDNDTVNLTPYLAWQLRPTSNFFHQGFLQVDAPLNRSDAAISATGIVTPDSNFSTSILSADETGEIDQQTLLRLNLGFGYWLQRGDGNSTLRGLAGLFEVHYTSTLDEANPFVVPAGRLLATSPGIDDIPIDIAAGPINDIDQVNLSTGLAAYVGSLQITNGIVVPVSENDDDRSFDFEYSLQINRRY